MTAAAPGRPHADHRGSDRLRIPDPFPAASGGEAHAIFRQALLLAVLVAVAAVASPLGA
jgi:hypothetical protein